MDSGAIPGTDPRIVANASPETPSAEELPHLSTARLSIAAFRRRSAAWSARVQVAKQIRRRTTVSSVPSVRLNSSIASLILPFLVGAEKMNSRAYCSFNLRD